jgi:hypothetical protein
MLKTFGCSQDSIGVGEYAEEGWWINVIILVFLSLTPPIFEYLKSRLEKKKSANRDQGSDVAAIENEPSKKTTGKILA